MLRYHILCVGRRAKDPLLDAAEDYLGRLGRYARAELLRLRESDAAAEGRDILGKLQPDDHVVVLDERGEQCTTRQLAARVRAWEGTPGRVVLIIGGADGLHADVLGRASERLALSRLTLPHRMALALLLEQVYRAHTILKGEKYHRD